MRISRMALALAFTLCTCGSVRADDELYKALDHSPELTPEKCATAPPQVILERVRKAGLDVGYGSNEDCFFQTYASHLQILVDHRFPTKTRLREPLNDAFQSLNSLFATANGFGTGFTHEGWCLPGRVEWMLYQIGVGVDEDRAAYTRNDVERLAEIISLANMRATLRDREPAATEVAVRKEIAEFTASLRKLEANADVPTRAAIRRFLVDYIKQSI